MARVEDDSGQQLTDKQAAFVREYLVDRNATQAATRAGYSAKTANEQGARLLANASIKKAVERGLQHAYSTRWRTRFHADGGRRSTVIAATVPR